MCIIKCRYYGAWSLMQATLAASGLSYNGMDN